MPWRARHQPCTTPLDLRPPGAPTLFAHCRQAAPAPGAATGCRGLLSGESRALPSDLTTPCGPAAATPPRDLHADHCHHHGRRLDPAPPAAAGRRDGDTAALTRPARARLSAAVEPLADGEARLRIDAFALTSNNVTYAAFGEAMKYWQFFPCGDAAWGCIPVWGFAEVVESRAAGVEPVLISPGVDEEAAVAIESTRLGRARPAAAAATAKRRRLGTTARVWSTRYSFFSTASRISP